MYGSSYDLRGAIGARSKRIHKSQGANHSAGTPTLVECSPTRLRVVEIAEKGEYSGGLYLWYIVLCSYFPSKLIDYRGTRCRQGNTVRSRCERVSFPPHICRRLAAGRRKVLHVPLQRLHLGEHQQIRAFPGSVDYHALETSNGKGSS